MNIAQNAVKTEKPPIITKTIYITIKYDALINAINNTAGDEQPPLAPKFNGQGKKMVYIPEAQEATFLSYSFDKAGTEPAPQPFEIDAGERIEFKLQAASDDSNTAKAKWKNIIQSRYDLRLVSGKKSTYDAVATAQAATEAPANDSEIDDVIIEISVKQKGEKYAIAWDPKVRIRRGN